MHVTITSLWTRLKISQKMRKTNLKIMHCENLNNSETQSKIQSAVQSELRPTSDPTHLIHVVVLSGLGCLIVLYVSRWFHCQCLSHALITGYCLHSFAYWWRTIKHENGKFPVLVRQHCRLSICSYFGWVWQILNLRRAGLSSFGSWVSDNDQFKTEMLAHLNSECIALMFLQQKTQKLPRSETKTFAKKWMPSDWVSVLQASGSDSFGRYCSRPARPPPPPSGELPLLPLIISCSPTASVFDIVNSDRSSYSDVVLLYIRSGSNFFRCSLSPWMQLMLQVSLEVAKTITITGRL